MPLSHYSLCYHPTSVVLLDDNARFLKSLKDLLSPLAPVQSFVSPSETQEWLLKNKHYGFLESCFTRTVKNDWLEEFSVGINLDGIKTHLITLSALQK